MIDTVRVTLKQYRLEVALATVGAMAVVLLWVYLQARLAGIVVPDSCIGSAQPSADPVCGPSINALRPAVAAIGDQILEVMRIVPFAAGLLTGVSIVARELETGTAQTAWSLNGSRRRWLARQAVIVAAPMLLAVGAAALAAESVESLRQASLGGPAVLNVGQYGAPAIIRAASTFGLGMLLGALLGRSASALALGAMLCFVLYLGLGVARDQWLAQQPSEPIPDGVTTSITTGFAYRTPQGTTVAEADAMALVPPDVAAQDDGQVQPVASATWLEAQGYVLVPLGVSQQTAMGWVGYDMLTFGLIGMLSLGATVLVIDRRRPT